MKINTPEAIEAAKEVFRSYGNSWSAARAAGSRDADGMLVISPRRTGKAGDQPSAERKDSLGG